METSVRFLITLPQLGVTWPDSGPCGLAFVVKLYTIRRNPSLKQDTFFLTACGRVRLCIYKEPKVTHRGETCPAEPPNSLLLLHLEGWIHHLGRVGSWTGGADEPRNIGLWWIQHLMAKGCKWIAAQRMAWPGSEVGLCLRKVLAFRFPFAWNKSHISWKHQEPESGVRISISNLLFCNESTGVSQLLGCLGLKMSSTIWCKGAYSYPLAWEYMNGVAYFISDFGWWFRNLNSCPLHPLHPFDCPHVRHWAARLPDSGEP